MGAAAHDLLIEIAVADKVGSAMPSEHELVQLLYDQDVFLQVEADIPVPIRRPSSEPTGDGCVIFDDQPCSDNIKAAPRDWVLKELRVPEALALLPPASANGKGIRIGHPDSGYSGHFALGLDRLDLQNDRDVISSDDDAVDPLHPPKSTFFHPLPNPGHGTSTASVMVGHGEQAFVGIAQAAEVVPIRATESVVQVFDTDVAKAVRWARTSPLPRRVDEPGRQRIVRAARRDPGSRRRRDDRHGRRRQRRSLRDGTGVLRQLPRNRGNRPRSEAVDRLVARERSRRARRSMHLDCGVRLGDVTSRAEGGAKQRRRTPSLIWPLLPRCGSAGTAGTR